MYYLKTNTKESAHYTIIRLNSTELLKMCGIGIDMHKDKLKSRAIVLFDHFGMSSGLISKYFARHYKVKVHRSTIHRWLNS